MRGRRNDLIPVRIEKVVYPGKSLAAHAGKVLFTDEGLPGEVVGVGIEREKKNFSLARTESVLERSPWRREPRCPHYKACSPYQIMEHETQLRIKADQVAEIFARQVKAKAEVAGVLVSPETWGYRNKVRLQVVRTAGGCALAYHRPAAGGYVEVERCFLVSDRMNELLAAAARILALDKNSPVEEVEVKETARGESLLLVLGGKGMRDPEPLSVFGRELGPRFPLSGIVWVEEKGGQVIEVLLRGPGYLEERLGPVLYRYGPRSFFQVNRHLLEPCLQEVRKAAVEAGVARFADLYCGVGFFGLFIAPEAEEVYGLESEASNIAFLKQNIEINRAANYTVFSGRAEEGLKRLLARKPDMALVDPPRAGLDKAVIRALLETRPRFLLYLSCDPATLARDLALLLGPYALRSVKLFDFFPHTPHIETFCVLERSGP